MTVTGRREGPLPAFAAGRVTDLPCCLSAGRLITPAVRSSDSGLRLPWTQSALPASSVLFSGGEGDVGRRSGSSYRPCLWP